MSLASARSLFRQFIQRPALMIAATATLGVSIGAATAISSAVKAVLLAARRALAIVPSEALREE